MLIISIIGLSGGILGYCLYEKTNFIDVETNLEKLQVKSKEYLKSVVEEI